MKSDRQRRAVRNTRACAGGKIMSTACRRRHMAHLAFPSPLGPHVGAPMGAACPDPAWEPTDLFSKTSLLGHTKSSASLEPRRRRGRGLHGGGADAVEQIQRAGHARYALAGHM